MDCDDTDSSYNPGAVDIWYDGYDHDCAGNSDYDADADGYDSDAYAGTDCEDADWAVNPGATEVWYDGVDSDCDAASDYEADGDGEDSDAYSGVGCDDADSAVNTSATEECDGVDNDCDGNTDFGICGEWSLDAFVQIDGGAAYDGLSFPTVGDVDGDGQDDLLGSSVGYGTVSTSFDYGAAFLFYGPITSDTDTSGADWMVSGASSGDALGAGQPNLADLNGDGWDDMLIPARYDDNNKGEVLLYLGSATRRSGSTTSSNSGTVGYYGRIYGAKTGDNADNFGTSGSSHIGDIDGDGHLDLAIGHSYDDIVTSNDGRGSALLLMSSATTLTGGHYSSIGATRVYGEGTGSRLSAAKGVGDVDGDGIGDLVFNSPNPASSGSSLPPYVYFVDGTESSLLGGSSVNVSSIWTARYTTHSGLGGEAVNGRGGGDIDGDGYSDLLLTDNYADDTLGNQVGHAYIVLGSSSISGAASMDSAYDLLIYGTVTSSGNTRFGETAAVTPDVDGDGIYEDFDGNGNADIVVGQNDSAEGGVFVFFSDTLTTQLSSGASSVEADTLADAILRQPNPSDEARDIAFGDLDGDGSTDLIVGSSGYDAGGATSTGAIFIVPGTLK